MRSGVVNGTRAEVPGRGTGKPCPAVCGHPRRRKSVGQDSGDRQTAGKGQHDSCWRGNGLYFSPGKGYKTGKSLVEADKTEVAKAALAKARERSVKFLIPLDDVIAAPIKTEKLDK